MRHRFFAFRPAICGLILFAASCPAWAQVTGAIEGTITDPTHAPVPAAAVKITDQRTGVVTTTTTNSTGYFLAAGLPVGTYEISVTQPGFKAYSVQGLMLDAATRLRRDITLQLGAVRESVTVEAAGAQVDTASGTVSSVITHETINTAVLNGRNFAKLVQLMPGAVYQSGSDELYTAGLSSPGSPVSINGLNNKTAGWFVDGAYNMNVGNGEANQHIPTLDSIEEVQVQTSNYSARYGTAGGAVINAVTRSGTSAFHGAAYEYFRNDKLDARNFFSPAKQPLKQNEYGFSIGGPVILPHYNKARNKTFFFWNEDWRARRYGTPLLTATPTDAMRAGDFSAEAARLKKPILDPLTKQPFPNNVIPADRIDPNAALLLKTYFPLPNLAGQGFQNYINTGVNKLDPRSDTVRIDHNITDNLRASFSLAHDDINVENPSVPLFGASPFPSIRQGESTVAWTGTGRLTQVITPTTTNELSYSFKLFNVNLILLDSPQASQHRPSGLTIRDFYANANKLNLIPNIGLAQGWGGIGTSQLPLSPATDDTRILADHFSHVLGRHTLQFGGLWFHYVKNQAIFNQTQGTYSFDGTFTNDPVADFMLGMARSYSQYQSLFVRKYAFDQTEWYGQDDWRVNARLTLNLGARLYVIPMAHVSGNQMSSFLPSRFDPAKAPQITSAGILVPTANYDPLNGIVFPEQNGVPRGFASTYFGFAPRFGFAYDPTGQGKMAIRGGYGISFLNSGNDWSSMVLNPPFNTNVSLLNVPLSDPSGGTPSALRPGGLNAFSPTFQRPMIQSWSLTLQRELPGQFLVSAGYVGTRGTNFEVWLDRNSPVFGAPASGMDFDPRLNKGYNTNLLRPFQGYGGITWFDNGLSSVYHSFQTTFQRRFANGLALQGTYTWSKTLGESQTARNMTVQNPLDWRADYGPADFDRTHVFSANYIYTLPMLKGRHDILGQMFGNWEISGFLSFESGLAMSPGLALGSRGLATRPNATGISPAGAKTRFDWFNTAAFAAPAPGMYGNAGTGVLRGPGFAIWDSSIGKAFPIKDKARLKFSAEFYNFLNHTNWLNVSTALGSGTYGQIVSARDPREIQLGLRLDF